MILVTIELLTGVRIMETVDACYVQCGLLYLSTDLDPQPRDPVHDGATAFCQIIPRRVRGIPVSTIREYTRMDEAR